MAQTSEPAPVHCYTNPSFCRQSEYIPDDRENLPPPPQFQSSDELPPPPPPLQMHLQCGQSNPAFQANAETRIERQIEETREGRDHRRYCYLNENKDPVHKRYASLPIEDRDVVGYGRSSRYEYIQEEQKRGHVQRRPSIRYEFIPRQQVQRQRSAPPLNQDDGRRGLQRIRTNQNNGGRYAIVPGEIDYPDEDDEDDDNGGDVNEDDEEDDDVARSASNGRRISPVRRASVNTPQGKATFIIYSIRNTNVVLDVILSIGRYARVPLQDEDPPALPERNLQQEYSTSPRNNLATKRLHEILTTPRKPRSRSEERTLSPKRQQSVNQTGTPQRRALTPAGSPSGTRHFLLLFFVRLQVFSGQ